MSEQTKAGEQGPSLQHIEQLIYRKLQSLKGVRSKQDEWMNEYLRNQKNASTVYPKFQPHLSYYQEFWKIYLVNEMMIVKIKELSGDNRFIKDHLTGLQDLQREHSRLAALRYKKKQRRPSSEISKNYRCPYDPCDRVYGCDVALNLHIKIKHNGGNKTERERLARQLIKAQEEGLAMPVIHLNFPPGFLERFRQVYHNEPK